MHQDQTPGRDLGCCMAHSRPRTGMTWYQLAHRASSLLSWDRFESHSCSSSKEHHWWRLRRRRWVGSPGNWKSGRLHILGYIEASLFVLCPNGKVFCSTPISHTPTTYYIVLIDDTMFLISFYQKYAYLLYPRSYMNCMSVPSSYTYPWLSQASPIYNKRWLCIPCTSMLI
jgi:hypothetical protein